LQVATLRPGLRCKEIRVVGPNRYRNPAEDLSANFEARRALYYRALNLPLAAEELVAALRAEMRKAL
jgi:hypothetical protein